MGHTATEAPLSVDPAERWAATMSGPSHQGVQLAHGVSTRIGPGAARDRVEREAAERHELVTGATLSAGAGRRAVAEAPDPLRTCFERDRDRILHSTAFRRLAGKTQVFVFPSDHQRTRLTHALEVSQVATAIALACRLNVALTEAIALGHDCGHGPGGHASEHALAPYLPQGFDHAVWGADVVLQPLNLCVETLDGVRNHSWSRPPPSTPEAEVVSWADRIAYVCHDFEDAVHAGVVHADDLPPIVRERVGDTRGRQLASFIGAVVDTVASTGIIGMDNHAAAALAAFRAFNHERIYLRPASIDQGRRVTELLRALTDHLIQHPQLLPDPQGPSPLAAPAEVIAAVTHVAGMTDRYACTLASRELDWPIDALPRGIDLFG